LREKAFKADIPDGKTSLLRLQNPSSLHATNSLLHHITSLQRTLCPCGGGCPRCGGAIQAKLKIGEPNDVYEQEADRVADQVMRMPEPAVQMKPG